VCVLGRVLFSTHRCPSHLHSLLMTVRSYYKNTCHI
jgi:hypothetical protein